MSSFQVVLVLDIYDKVVLVYLVEDYLVGNLYVEDQVPFNIFLNSIEVINEDCVVFDIAPDIEDVFSSHIFSVSSNIRSLNFKNKETYRTFQDVFNYRVEVLYNSSVNKHPFQVVMINKANGFSFLVQDGDYNI